MTDLSGRLAGLAEPWWREAALRSTAGQDQHRELMRFVAAGVALRTLGHGASSAQDAAVMMQHVERLAQLQGEDGLFSSDGNLHSPPDSSFTLNDLGITLGLLEALADPELEPVDHGLRAIARAAVPAVVVGGVHTPNHRWEISSALVRLARFDDHAVARAQEWLAEGVDIDADGLYSERSANYAAHVSNPSLLVLAEHLDRPDLRDLVHRNLHAYLDLTDADGVAETVFSRRQDHDKPILLESFHTQLRIFAIAGCDECRAAAQVSEPTSARQAVAALIEVAADPTLGADLGPVLPGDKGVERHFAGVGLLVRQHGDARTVVYGGSDVPHVGRVGSGIAANPTFLRFRSGAAAVRSLRLSRVFFGLGPFRAESLEVDDGVARLHESVAARYYQPLPAAARRAHGDYRLTDDGRFTASMAFDERAHDEVRLTTDIVVQPVGDRLEVAFEIDGATTRWSLELALGDGELTGVEQVADDTYRMTGNRAELRHGSDAVVIETSLDPSPGTTGWYDPGEAYAFLGGTDALTGPRMYLTGTTPATWTLTLRPV